MAPEKKRRAWLYLGVAGGLLVAGPAWAQIVPSNIPVTMPSNDSLLGTIAPGSPPPSADPRNLDGVYQPEVPGSAGAPPRPGSGGRPGAAPGAPKNGNIGLGELAAGIAGKPPAESPKRVASAEQLCEPAPELGFGGDVNQIISTPGRITFIQEAGHVVRRVHLDQKFPAHITPAYTGYSIGHWVGDTLVIETRGLKSPDITPPPLLASITDLVETVRKIDGGKRLEIIATIEGVDGSGNQVTMVNPYHNRWRSDLHLEELICETGGQFFFNSFQPQGSGS